MRHLLLGATVLATIVAAAMWPPIPQSPAYHLFADTRSLLGIPNCLNVVSNLPFAIIGVLGLMETFSRRSGRTAPFSDPWERWPYAALFGGVVLTSLGSAHYHLAPDNARLAWDRLPMSVGFMGLLTALLAERVSLSIGFGWMVRGHTLKHLVSAAAVACLIVMLRTRSQPSVLEASGMIALLSVVLVSHA